MSGLSAIVSDFRRGDRLLHTPESSSRPVTPNLAQTPSAPQRYNVIAYVDRMYRIERELALSQRQHESRRSDMYYMLAVWTVCDE